MQGTFLAIATQTKSSEKECPSVKLQFVEFPSSQTAVFIDPLCPLLFKVH